jgi:hypothetical protein
MSKLGIGVGRIVLEERVAFVVTRFDQSLR